MRDYAVECSAYKVSINVLAMVKTLHAFVGTSHWMEQTHYPAVRVPLPFPTAGPVELTRAAHRLLPSIDDGTRYARAGIMLVDLSPAGTTAPLDAFRHPHEDLGLAAVIDQVQHRVGRELIGLGWGDSAPAPCWTMKRDTLTSRATTHWDELAIAKV